MTYDKSNPLYKKLKYLKVRNGTKKLNTPTKTIIIEDKNGNELKYQIKAGSEYLFGWEPTINQWVALKTPEQEVPQDKIKRIKNNVVIYNIHQLDASYPTKRVKFHDTDTHLLEGILLPRKGKAGDTSLLMKNITTDQDSKVILIKNTDLADRINLGAGNEYTFFDPQDARWHLLKKNKKYISR